MQIDTSYAEADVGNIRVGQHATFRVDAFPNRTFRGEVRQVRLNPTTQQNVVTYDVVVAVNNQDQTLLPGMTAYVSIVVAQRKDVLTVPNAALRFRPSDTGARTDKARSGSPGSEKHNKDKAAEATPGYGVCAGERSAKGGSHFSRYHRQSYDRSTGRRDQGG